MDVRPNITTNTENDMNPSQREGEQNPKAEKKKQKKSVGREILEWILCLAIALAVALPVRAFVFEPIRVDGHSMIDTLQDGERLFVTKFDYLLGEPQRFDVVICHYPNRTENFVKRIVGLPGDTVEMRGGLLYVNGERYPEEYLTHRANYDMSPYTVPEGEYFVLGDNRSNSNDSHLVGPISRGQLVGHVRAVFFPFNKIRSVA